MLEKITGKKIELMSKIPKEGEIICPECDGIGWLQKDEKWIENCPHCHNGLLSVCPYCGEGYKSTLYYHLMNNKECFEKDREEKNIKQYEAEKLKFEKAIKYTYNECPNESKEMMYSEHYGYNEGYFTDLDEFYEYIESEEDATLPQYVWTTYKISLSMDAGSIIESACDNLHEDACSNISDEDEKELQDLLDQWCHKQDCTDTYYPNYKAVILIQKEEK